MPRRHAARVLPSPIAGVFSTHIDSDQHFGRHWHDGYGFGFLEEGAQVWRSDRGTVRGYPGDVITTNPGEVHDGRPIGDGPRRWRIVSIDVETMAGVIADRGRSAAISSPVIADPALIQTLRRLFSCLDRWNAHRDHANALAFEEALAESCVRLMARHGSAPVGTRVPPANLSRVRDRLAEDLSDSLSLAEMAVMTGLSRYQVLRRFEQAFGLPPHAWLLHHRAERARQLIRDGSTLASSAAACGFVDQSHMTRVFTRQFGFTPGAWRAASG